MSDQDWREPGDELPPAHDEQWLDPADLPGEAYPNHPTNKDHIPRGAIYRLFGAMLLCLLAGMIVSAGLNMRQQTFLGWLIIVAGALLVIPAVRIGLRSMIKLLISFNQMNRRGE